MSLARWWPWRPNSTFDALALVAWLDKGRLLAAIEAEVDASADASALTADQRAARLSQLSADLLAAERDVAAVAERDGKPAPVDLDPRAALMIDGPAPREF